MKLSDLKSIIQFDTDFTNYDDAYKFYCDNLPHNNYIELAGVWGIIGRTLMYNSKENE